MAASVEDLMQYLGIDWADEAVAANARRCLAAADAYVTGAIGADVDRDDARCEHVTLAVAADMYDNRQLMTESGGSKVSGAMRSLVRDLSLQLRVESGG